MLNGLQIHSKALFESFALSLVSSSLLKWIDTSGLILHLRISRDALDFGFSLGSTLWGSWSFQILLKPQSGASIPDPHRGESNQNYRYFGEGTRINKTEVNVS